MRVADAVRVFGLWMHTATAKWPLFSWFVHGVVALPLVAVVAWVPWLGPGVFFFYREAEQVWHRWLNKQGFVWVDHFMDVVVPLLVGWLFLH